MFPRGSLSKDGAHPIFSNEKTHDCRVCIICCYNDPL